LFFSGVFGGGTTQPSIFSSSYILFNPIIPEQGGLFLLQRDNNKTPFRL